MKKVRVMTYVLMMVCLGGSVFGQDAPTDARLESVPPVPIKATFEQTTTLLFPFDVLSVDWGSSGIIVQQRKGVKNILHVKAAKKGFGPTSLSVVTSDGEFYSFVVRYATDPGSLTYLVHPHQQQVLAAVDNNVKRSASIAQRVTTSPDFLHLSTRSSPVRVHLRSLYVADEKLWMKLQLTNYSLLDVTLRDVRFAIKDVKAGKRRVGQEKEIMPVYAEEAKIILGKSTGQWVFGFDAFAVTKGKRFVIQVSERQSSRLVELKVPRRLFRKIRRLPSL